MKIESNVLILSKTVIFFLPQKWDIFYHVNSMILKLSVGVFWGEFRNYVIK